MRQPANTGLQHQQISRGSATVGWARGGRWLDDRHRLLLQEGVFTCTLDPTPVTLTFRQARPPPWWEGHVPPQSEMSS